MTSFKTLIFYFDINLSSKTFLSSWITVLHPPLVPFLHDCSGLWRPSLVGTLKISTKGFLTNYVSPRGHWFRFRTLGWKTLFRMIRFFWDTVTLATMTHTVFTSMFKTHIAITYLAKLYPTNLYSIHDVTSLVYDLRGSIYDKKWYLNIIQQYIVVVTMTFTMFYNTNLKKRKKNLTFYQNYNRVCFIKDK